jgi:hypothetical protein
MGPYSFAQALAQLTPVPNNLDGEYLTMFSRGGLIFGIINLVGAMAGVLPALCRTECLAHRLVICHCKAHEHEAVQLSLRGLYSRC